MKTTSSLSNENEYLMLVSSANTINEKINEARIDLQKKYNFSGAFGSADIFLAKFNNLNAREQLLLNAIHESVRGIAPMFISLRNILEIPKHSFVIPVTSKIILTDLVKSLKQITKAIRTADVKPLFTDNFNVPLFSKLQPQQFEKLLPECRQYHFSAQFIATEIRLLKKDSSQSSSWKTLSTFQLKKENNAVQSQLF